MSEQKKGMDFLKDKRVLAAIAAVVLLVIIIVIAVVAKGCNKKEEVANTEPINQVTEKQKEEKVDLHPGKEQSPLSGVWEEPDKANKQIIAMMIENSADTIPHYNISKADVIYELPVEGGITRLMGLFQDYDGLEKVGNVRSARYSYLYFAKEYDAVYFHCGSNTLAEDLINQNFIQDVDGITGKGGSFFYRETNEPGRVAPHNLYTSGDMIQAALKEYGYPEQVNDSAKGHFKFAEENEKNILASGQDVKAFSVYYAHDYPHFIYDEKSGLYQRYEFDQPHMDAATNSQIEFSNVIIQNADISYFSDGVVCFDPVASGTGKFFTQGKMIDITWKKESDSAPTKYYDTNGNEITLKQGKTFICVQNKLDIEKNGFYASVEEFNNK